MPGKTTTTAQTTAQTKPVAAVPTETSEPLLKLSEAMLVHQFLFQQQKLCGKCGYRLVAFTTTYHAHCTECKEDRLSYMPAKGITDLDRMLCKRFGSWVESVVKGEGFGNPNPSNNSS